MTTKATTAPRAAVISVVLDDKKILGICLLLALIHGLLYLFLMPPWQHYDEPNHFEFAWLIANKPDMPKSGDFDPALSRAVVKSMRKYHFYDGMGYVPNVKDEKAPVIIDGYPQLDVPPLYYIIASTPLRFLKEQNVAVQLYAGRAVSLLFFLLTILAAWGIARDLVKPNNSLRWMVPVSLALLPGFADLMTALNNDTLAVCIFSLSLWGDVRLMRRGFSWQNLLLAGVPALLSPFAKSTALLTLPLLAIALAFSVLRGKYRSWVWVGLVIGSLIGAASIFSLDDAAFWYRNTSQADPTRIVNPQAPDGSHALGIDLTAYTTPDWVPNLFQPLTPQEVMNLRGKKVTLGVWVWADQPVDAYLPIVWDGWNSFTRTVTVSTQPAFYAFNVSFKEDVERIWLTIDERSLLGSAQGKLYMDGLVLVEGDLPPETPPTFSTFNGERGTWGSTEFVNYARNASFENAGPRLQPWADQIGSKILPDNNRPSFILTSLIDLNSTYTFYLTSATHLLRTFWAQFGWAHVMLIGQRPYRWLALVTLIGLAGAGWAFLYGIRQRTLVAWDILLVLGLALLAMWGGSLTRGVTYLTMTHLYVPVARYTYPVIIPTIFVLCIGWRELINLVGRAFRNYRELSYGIFWIFWIGLDLVSIASIMTYYGR